MKSKFDVHPLPRLADGRPPILTSGFNLPKHPGFDPKGRIHRGSDFFYEDDELTYPRGTGKYGIPEGVHALAALPGRVVYAELNYESWVPGNHCTGFVVVLDHGDGLRTAYHHLATVLVHVGDHLMAGERLGLVGGSPNRAGYKPGTPGLVHLHLDAMKIKPDHVDSRPFDATKAGTYCDPAPFCRKVAPIYNDHVWIPTVDLSWFTKFLTWFRWPWS